MAGTPLTNRHTNTIMGDRSPKSKQKDKNQKQGKADAATKAKQRAMAGKQQSGLPGTKKKK